MPWRRTGPPPGRSERCRARSPWKRRESARLTALAVLASLAVTLGTLDRVAAWLTVSGFVNADPGYEQTTLVMNPFSDLLLSVFGPEVGEHARTAIGVATVPLNLPVVVAAEVEIRPGR